jgi:beta-lactamase regulating signal transducer with metallopeptidase domain
MSKKVMVNIGYKLLALFLLFTVLRFVIPIELPFSVTVCAPEMFSNIIRTICHAYIHVGNIPLSLWNIFLGIWFIGAIVQTIRTVMSDRHLRKYLNVYGQDVTDCEPYREIIARVCTERNKKNNFKILLIPDAETPVIYGLFRPHIIIPADLDLSDEELYYTLSHEAAHYFHHDLFITLGVRILNIIYWWNPAAYVLKDKSSLILEMRVDDYLTRYDKKITRDYLDCLIKIYEYAVEEDSVTTESITLSFNKKSKYEMSKRFDLMCNAGKTRNKTREKTLNVLTTVGILAIYFLSYRFIFEPYYYPSEVASYDNEVYSDYFLPLDTTYIIENADGTYSVYLDTGGTTDFYLETLDSLDDYKQGFTIYYLEKGNFK